LLAGELSFELAAAAEEEAAKKGGEEGFEDVACDGVDEDSAGVEAARDARAVRAEAEH
jgi:hypothetical protein